MDELGRQRELGEIFLAITFAAMAGLGAWLTSSLLTLFGTIGSLSAITLYIWQRTCLMRLTYRRTVSETRADFGQRVAIGVELVNDKILPLPWIRVIDHFPHRLFPNQPTSSIPTSIHGTDSSIKVALATSQSSDPIVLARIAEIEQLRVEGFIEYTQSFAMLPFQRVHRTINIECSCRGRHRFGKSQVISGDPLGIRPRTLVVEHEHDLIVYPKIFPLLVPSIFSRTPLGDDRASRRILGDPTRIAGMRPYRAGDPLRHVDWRATARRSELLVRDFEPTTTLRLELFVDCQLPELDDLDPTSSPSEFALSLGASLITWSDTQGIPIGLHTNGIADGEPIAVQPGSGPLETTHLLERLALCEADPAQRFGDHLILASAHLQRGSSVIVIASDFTDELLLGIAECRRRSPIIAIQVVGLEGSPPPRNLVDASYQVIYQRDWQRGDHVVIA